LTCFPGENQLWTGDNFGQIPEVISACYHARLLEVLGPSITACASGIDFRILKTTDVKRELSLGNPCQDSGVVSGNKREREHVPVPLVPEIRLVQGLGFRVWVLGSRF